MPPNSMGERRPEVVYFMNKACAAMARNMESRDGVQRICRRGNYQVGIDFTARVVAGNATTEQQR